MAVLREYADVIARSGAQAVRMVATSATRDADNAAEFVRLVKEVLGVAPEVLTGDEEAMLSFTGATAELAAGPDPGPFLVADIGGGSTEFVLGEAGGRPAHAISVNIGCVRMTERHLHGDPPTDREVAAAVADIDAALEVAAAAVPVREARTLIGLAGSVTTVAAIAMGLPAYDATRIHHARVAAADVHAVTRGLLAQTRAERAAIGVMHPGRVDVIGGGALILDRLMRAVRLRRGPGERARHPGRDGLVAGWRPARLRRRRAPWEQVPSSRRAAGPMTPPGRARPSRAARPRWPTWPPERARWTSSSRASRSAAPARAWWPGARTWPSCAAVRSGTSPTGAAPSPAGGRPGRALLIVGLAPAAHGGNRTGRIFTGDRSGDFLFASLYRCGWAAQPTSVAMGDGQRLLGARMVAAVRCAPPDNKPEPAERDTCAPWLTAELRLVAADLRVIVCLGGFAWQAIWPVLGQCGFARPRPRPAVRSRRRGPAGQSAGTGRSAAHRLLSPKSAEHIHRTGDPGHAGRHFHPRPRPC